MEYLKHIFTSDQIMHLRPNLGIRADLLDRNIAYLTVSDLLYLSFPLMLLDLKIDTSLPESDLICNAWKIINKRAISKQIVIF